MQRLKCLQEKYAWYILIAGLPLVSLGNADYKNITLGKAGRTRHLGIRPTVRGMAMNPVDHPHGGGEGRSKSGSHPVSPWGKGAKGTRTRKRANPLILKRRKK